MWKAEKEGSGKRGGDGCGRRGKMERMEEEEKEYRRTSIVGINGKKRKNLW